MYCVLIPVKYQELFEKEAEKQGLLLAISPESAHKLHYNQPVEKIGYEFFTEEEFEKARKISKNIRVTHFLEKLW